MSTSRHCLIMLANDGRWYMELQRSTYDDTMEWYGPFASAEAADRYLSKFSNPGGYSLDESGKNNPPKKYRK